MARVEGGVLYLEIEGASEGQLRDGLAAARQSFGAAGADIRSCFEAQARVDEAGQTELAWEQGLIAEYAKPSEGDRELDEIVGEAWFAAVRAAGFDPSEGTVIGKFGLLPS